MADSSKGDRDSVQGFSPEKLGRVLFSDIGLNQQSDFAVAYSGGCDSQALLHALCALRSKFNIRVSALHFDHGLNEESARWSQHCEQWCQELGAAFLSERQIIQPQAGESLEATAREARYRWFGQVMKESQILLTAHHADDQAETVLMNLLRGKGVEHLSGMPQERPLSRESSVRLVRPLLGFSRSDLMSYAKRHRLQWIEDPSNFSSDFDRNYLRNEVLPLIKQRWPSALDSINKSATRLGEAFTLNQGHLDRLYQAVIRPQYKRLFCLLPPVDLAGLRDVTRYEQAEVIRMWIHCSGNSSPSDRQLEALCEQSALSDSAYREFDFDNYVIRRFDDHFYLTSRIKISEHQAPGYDFSDFRLDEIDMMMLTDRTTGGGIDPDRVAGKPLKLVWRQGGEKINLPGRDHRHSLKKLYQQNGIPPWERDYLPFIATDEEIIWVSGIGVADGYQCEGNKIGILPRFQQLCD